MAQLRVLINGLSIGTGGGYTVGRALFHHLALARPDWDVSILLTRDRALHQEMADDRLPPNCRLLWAPSETARVWARARYERRALPSLIRENRIDRVVQLNGMIVPTVEVPTFSHCQDPWPYRREAWCNTKDLAVAYLKRREQAKAVRQARWLGFTSGYLRDLICTYFGHKPDRAEVLHNGLPDEWIERASGGVPSWDDRPFEIATISSVTFHKRQELVLRALPDVIRATGLRDLVYRVVGAGHGPYMEQLAAMTRSLGLEKNVVFEGRVSDERVQEVFRTARAYVLMSVCESFGIPAIEAMTFGTPVVTADCCAMPEVCGDAAILSPVDDEGALAANIARVLSDASLALQMQDRGVRQVQKFRWSNTAAKLATCLEN